MSLEQNVAASQAANAVFDLAMEEATNHANDAALRFWMTILKQVLNVVPESLHPKRIVQAPVVPMTDDKCDAFEATCMEFGKYYRKPLAEVPLEYLEWLDAQPDFRQQLRRYLATRRVQRHMTVSECEEGRCRDRHDDYD